MYVLAKNNSIVALDAATGKEIWTHENARGRHHRPTASTTGRARTAAIAACCSRTTACCRRSTRGPASRFRRSASTASSTCAKGWAAIRHSDLSAIDHARARLREPDHSRLGDQPGVRVRPRRHARLRRAHRQAGLDVSHDSRIRASSATTRGRRTRGRPSAARTTGREMSDRREARHRLRPDRAARNTTSTAPTAPAPTCSATACSRSTRGPASGSGTSRWSITTSGTTTTRRRRSC